MIRYSFKAKYYLCYTVDTEKINTYSRSSIKYYDLSKYLKFQLTRFIKVHFKR